MGREIQVVLQKQDVWVMGSQPETECIDDDRAMIPGAQRQVWANKDLRLESESLQLFQRMLAHLSTLLD
jgi:hypothetical protein